MISRSVVLFCLLILPFSVSIKGHSNVEDGQCEDMRQGYFHHYYCTLQCFAETLHLSFVKGDLCKGIYQFASNQNTPVPLPVVGKVIECITIRCKSAVPPSVCGSDLGPINKNDAPQNSQENSKYSPEAQTAKVKDEIQPNSADLASEDNHDTKENKGDKELVEAENKSIKDTSTAEGVAYSDNKNEKLDYDSNKKNSDNYEYSDFYYDYDYEDDDSDNGNNGKEIVEEKTSDSSATDSEKKSDTNPAITGKIKDNKESDKDSTILEDSKDNTKSDKVLTVTRVTKDDTKSDKDSAITKDTKDDKKTDKDAEITEGTKDNKKIDKDTEITGDTKDNKQTDKDPIKTEDAKDNKKFDKDSAVTLDTGNNKKSDKDSAIAGDTKEDKKFDKDSELTGDTKDNKKIVKDSATEPTKENKKIDKDSEKTNEAKDNKKSEKDLEITDNTKDSEKSDDDSAIAAGNTKSDKDSEITVNTKDNKKTDKDSAVAGDTNDNKKSDKDSTIAGDSKDNNKSDKVNDGNHLKKIDSVKETKENDDLKTADKTEITSNKDSKTDSATDVNGSYTEKNIKQKDNEKSTIKEKIDEKSNEHSTKSETASLNPKNEEISSPNKNKKDSSKESKEHSLPTETSQQSLSSVNSEGSSPTECTEDSLEIKSSKKEASTVSSSAINKNDKSKSSDQDDKELIKTSETDKVEVASSSSNVDNFNNRNEGEDIYYYDYLFGDDYDTPVAPSNKNEDNSGSNKNANVDYQSSTKNNNPNGDTNSNKSIEDQPIINLNHQNTQNTERTSFPFNKNDKYRQSDSGSVAFENSETSPGAKITKNDFSAANINNKNNYQLSNDKSPLNSNYPISNNAGNLNNQKNSAQNSFQSPYPNTQQYPLGQNPQNYNIPQGTYALSQANSHAATQNQQYFYNHPLNSPPYQNQFVPYPYGNNYNLKNQPGNQYWGSFGAPNQGNNRNIPYQSSISAQRTPNMFWNSSPVSKNQQAFPPNNMQFPNYGSPNVAIQSSIANMRSPPSQVYRQIPPQNFQSASAPSQPNFWNGNGPLRYQAPSNIRPAYNPPLARNTAGAQGYQDQTVGSDKGLTFTKDNGDSQIIVDGKVIDLDKIL